MSIDIRDHTIPAGEKLRLSIVGKYFTLLETAGNLNITFKRAASKMGEALNVSAPFAIGPMVDGFEIVELEAVSGAETVAKVGITEDPVEYQRISGVVSVDVGSTLANAAVSVTTGAAVQLFAASSGRRSVFVWNNSTANTIFVGADNTVSSANGWPIGPQSGLNLDKAAAAALWAIATGAACDVRTLAESD